MFLGKEFELCDGNCSVIKSREQAFLAKCPLFRGRDDDTVNDEARKKLNEMERKVSGEFNMVMN